MHCCSVAKSCTALCDPMDCSLVHGILQARFLEWVTTSFSRGPSWPRDRTHISCIGRQVVYHQATKEVCIGWPKSLFGFFHKMLQKNPNDLFGQPNKSYLNKSVISKKIEKAQKTSIIVNMLTEQSHQPWHLTEAGGKTGREVERKDRSGHWYAHFTEGKEEKGAVTGWWN